MSKKYDFSESTVKKRRKFPVVNTLILALLVALQVFLLIVAVVYEPEPQDRIEEYSVYVTPLDDGSLNVEYRFKWKALDEDEPLSWVEIGMPNENFVLISHSDNVMKLANDSGDGYCYAVVDFYNSYVGGATVDFSFKVNQRDMLCENNGTVFYEFVPSWFNSIEVEHYSFNWKKSENVTLTNADSENGDWYTWEGSLGYGEYRKLKVSYDGFNAPTTRYSEFDDSGAYDGMAEEKGGVIALMIFFMLIVAVFEIIIIDFYVSYSRGRGFLRGYGHHVHVYGVRNPHYISAQRAHMNTSHGGGRIGGGCACACACACAGGGRAGCSQKDTYKNKPNEQ